MDDTRILIVEDEALFSQLLSQTLSNEPGLEVVGMAQDGETALRLVEKTEPDAVLMDIELDGEMDGVETALRIKKDRPSTGIVILSSHKDRRYVTTLPLGQSPGWSYLLKQTVADVGAIVRAIQGSIARHAGAGPSRGGLAAASIWVDDIQASASAAGGPGAHSAGIQ